MGREAVIVFFVLSGYVIAATTQPRSGQCPSARAYAAARLLLFGAWVSLGLEESLRGAGSAWWPLRSLPLGNVDRFLADYAVCAIVLLNFACAREAGFGAPLRIARPERLLAPRRHAESCAPAKDKTAA